MSCIIRFHSYEISRVGKSLETEGWLMAVRGWGKGKNQGVMANGRDGCALEPAERGAA